MLIPPPQSNALPTLGFIGLGVMGQSMARHLLQAGYPLYVYNRTRAKAEALLAAGACWAESPRDVAQTCSVVVTMVGYPQDVESIYLGSDGLVTHGAAGLLLIDMTTSSPALAKRIATVAAARGIQALDAPVSGGDLGAREARLSIMVGGEATAFAQARPLFEKMGRTVVHQGPAGAGQHCKLANQIAVAAGMLGVCESLAYARAQGMDPTVVLSSISGGAAGSWALNHLAPRILAGDYAPGFYVKHFLKDLRLTLDSAEEVGLDLPGTRLVYGLYRRLAALGSEDLGTQALARLYFEQTSV